jgi:hypothetical protein
MRAYANIVYRLARFFAGIPPEILGAMVLLAIQHPGLVAATFAVLFVIQMVVLKFVAVAIVFVLKYVVGIVVSGIITWYLGKLFAVHVWRRLPHDLKRSLLKLKDLILFAPSDQTSTRDDE